MAATEVPAEIRSKLALVVDVDDLVAAVRLGKAMSPYFGVAKIGLELYSAAGPDAIGTMIGLGYDVFLDLKLHDIPTTVNKSARVLGALGVSYLTMHAQGGVDMLKAGVDGLSDGATNAGLEVPNSLAITVLTSDGGAPEHIVPNRVGAAMEAGCTGVVCSVGDLKEVHHYGPRLVRVTPGIRLEGGPVHDHARPASPREALDAGSDLLVVGRAVTAAPDPLEAAERMVAELTAEGK